MQNGPVSARRKACIGLMRLLTVLSAALTCGLTLFLIGYVLASGLPHVTWKLLTTSPSILAGRIGILPDIMNTVYIILATLLLVLPLGVGAAVYLTEYAAGKRLVSLIEYASETLSGIPSIIYGLVGMLMFTGVFGTSLLAGALTLVIMNLPTVMRTAQESLKTVPQSYREGAFGLGAGKWRVIRTVVLPGCVDGIITGCILSVGRILGESAALLFTAGAVEESGQEYLERLSARDYRYNWTPDYRLTWVAPDGTVLFDTLDSAEGMENHADRVEVREALAKGESSSVRYSSTLTERTFYYARALSDGTVLRISIRQATILTLVLAMLQPILLVAILAAALSAVLAHRTSKRLVRPLNSLDLDHPLENDAYEELSPLLRRIHQQHRQISAQLHALQKKTDEFAQITGHMNEGLVLLDNSGRILSINPAAQNIFNTDTACVGQEFLRVDRSHDLSAAVRSTSERGYGEARAERSGREYQFDVSQIESDGAVIGTVLLAFDVTEQAAAERSRREFTANVSHELKTPLQSITGSAELLESGLVKPEDVPRFVSLIRTEAARLVTLVDDIIHLSQLDEGAAPVSEEVDIYEIAADAITALRGSAEAKKVHIGITGESAVVNGVRGFLYEMLYNLCDNAIKYNVEGGRVEVAVSNSAGGPVVSVKDTGIGIPAEYQARIFERFFRVDKSRSKASGGTGLGLSIVKHIAQYHHAAISLSSRVGEGTEITVSFAQA